MPVNVGEKGVRVEAWIPHEHGTNATQQMVDRVPTAAKPLFERSESGDVLFCSSLLSILASQGWL